MALPGELTFLIDLLALYGIYLIVSLSLNLEFGFAWIPNFGKVFSVAIGAFVAGFVPGRLAAWVMRISSPDYVRDNVRVVTEVNGVLQGNITMALSLLLATLMVAAVMGAVLGSFAWR